MKQTQTLPNILTRSRIWYVLILLLSSLIMVRAFQLQIIQGEYYTSAAFAGQFREYEIPASRGVIEAYSGDNVVPIVLNEDRFTLFVDPQNIEDAEAAADALIDVIPTLERDEVMSRMNEDNRFQVLRKKLTKPVADTIREKELPGVGLREQPQRTYPQGKLAAHILGFVNDEGDGVYGVEQALDDALRGKPGQLKAITDARGIPLAANQENTVIDPIQGQRTRLTIDVNLQQIVEDALEQGLERARSDAGSAIVMDASNGKVVALANYPTYDPARFFEIEGDDVELFQNKAVAAPLEIGSIMKPFTMAAALNEGVIGRETTYHDPDQFTVDGATIRNVEESSGVGTRSMEDILRMSLNTGATWLLKQMGGGDINERARVTWHEYMTDKYRFDQELGIQQGYESAGNIPSPTDGYGLNIQFANTAFGQGMTTTPLHVATALSSVVNGGTYHQPSLIDGHYDGAEFRQADVTVLNDSVISQRASSDVRELMEGAFAQNYPVYGMQQLREGYAIGGKTGTAEVPNPEGGYYDDRYNGTFMGYVSGAGSTYVIVVKVEEPRIGGYAGSTAAGPLFVDIAESLIDAYGVQPALAFATIDEGEIHD